MADLTLCFKEKREIFHGMFLGPLIQILMIYLSNSSMFCTRGKLSSRASLFGFLYPNHVLRDFPSVNLPHLLILTTHLRGGGNTPLPMW